MNAKHRRIHTRRCANCKQRFSINPRLGKRHRFCSQAECSKASRRAAQKKWLRKNGGKKFYEGNENGDRVRNWRKLHPHYWKRTHARGRARNPKVVLTRALAAAVRYVALQDTIDTRLALEIGIISEISGATLQDTIAKEIRRLTMRGYAILRGRPVQSIT